MADRLKEIEKELDKVIESLQGAESIEDKEALKAAQSARDTLHLYAFNVLFATKGTKVVAC